MQLPLRIERVLFAVLRDSESLAVLPISRRDILSAHEDFAVLIQFHFAALEHFPNRASPDTKRVIHADERSRFRQPVALNCRESGAAPESLRFQVQRRAAGNDGPEFPAKPPVNFPESPHAAENLFILAGGKILAERFKRPFRLEIALDLAL